MASLEASERSHPIPLDLMEHDRTQLTLLIEVAEQVGNLCLELCPALLLEQQIIKHQLESIQAEEVSVVEQSEIS